MKYQTKGGLARGKQLKVQSIKNYYSNPKKCLHCSKIILIKNNSKAAETRKKKFCNHSCSATYFNKKRPKIAKIKKQPRYSVGELTKGELLKKSKNYFSFRASIAKNARYIFWKQNKKSKCKICGYDKHVQIHHKIPVADFSKNVKIKTINNINNLIMVCPNHHWELENGFL